MSDAEWAVTEPALPAPAWTLGKGGRPGEYCRRDIVDGIRYLVKEGIQWRAVPVDFPHWRTVYDYADGWQKTGATERMHDELRSQCRIAAGRKPEPTAAVIDSQSVKAAETVAKPSRGYDAGKKINGRKRHIAVDTIGLLLAVLVTAAGVQDRDGAKPLLWNLRKAFPSVRLTWADSGYAGKLVTWATRLKPKLRLQIVKRTEQHKFVVLPRRLAEDYVQLNEIAHAAEIAKRVAELAAQANSARTDTRLRHLADLLRSHNAVPAVSEFFDVYHALLAGNGAPQRPPEEDG